MAELSKDKKNKLIFAVILFLAVMGSTGLRGQSHGASSNATDSQSPTWRFSSTERYGALQKEMQKASIRPSRMSAGTLREASAEDVLVKSTATTESLTVENGTWRLEMRKDTWGMKWTNKLSGAAWEMTNVGIGPVLRLAKVEAVERRGNRWVVDVAMAGSSETAKVEIDVLSNAIVHFAVHLPEEGKREPITLRFSGAGPFFGLGERFSKARLDGMKVTIHPEDLLGRKPDHNWTYIPVPFLLSPLGLGLYLDTSRVSTFDLSHAAQQQFSIQSDDSSVDLYLFAGKGPKDVITAYTSVMGRTPLPPAWTFGVWICSYQGPEQVLADARRLRQDDIPASAIWTYDVMGHGTIMGWPLWWTGYYPNPRELTDQLHSLGFKSLTYVYPFVRAMLPPYNLPNPSYDEGVKNGLFVRDVSGKPTGPAFEPYIDANIDFTSPKNVDWWQRQLHEVLIEDNFDGWMEDFGEWVKDSDRFANGKTGRDMANLYPLLYHQTTYDITQKLKPGAVEFSRSGYAGSQGYTPVVWGGDQYPTWSGVDGFPSVIPAGITAGLSGFSIWGPDIDGNGRSKELWTRWVEFGALSPVMRTHLWEKPQFAVNLWYDSQTLNLFRTYARLHISLFPYFYSYAVEAAHNGIPIIRHPMLEWPNDPQTYDAEDEYLLGKEILVAPVRKQGATTRSLYLPEGAWVDYWTGKVVAGDRHITVAAPLDKIPMFVKAGSILPFISPDTQTLATDVAGTRYRTLTNAMTWKVFPASAAASGSFHLYDGTTALVQQESAECKVEVRGSPVLRRYDVLLPEKERPREVLLDGKVLKEIHDGSSGVSEGSWWMDAEEGVLHVSLKVRNFSLDVSQ